MTDCPHDFVERETAVTADGMCPLCLARERDEARAALIEYGQHKPNCIYNHDSCSCGLDDALVEYRPMTDAEPACS